jgi:hypothetical protein|uniref:Virion structural protein n=1 Tax=Myoviridae sp. ctshb19 TaxID=2825194 RepID=A0A8S5UH06_9CAUD|nr:MAG TPA: hypothetical protein [Myoviridae sp. ctshb19]
MSLLQQDGFDHYGTTVLTTASGVSQILWLSAGYELPTGTTTPSTSYGKNTGSLGLGLAGSTADYVWLKKAIKPQRLFAENGTYVPAEKNTIVLGASIRFPAVPTGRLLFAKVNNIEITLGTDWYVYVNDVSTGYQCELNIWNFIELEIDYATGKFRLWMTDANVFEMNLPAGFVADYWEIKARWLTGSNVGTLIVHVDDFYMIDGTGTYNNQRVGKSYTLTRYPTADSEIAMTPSTGATNWNLVSEPTPNLDTNYVTSAVPDAVDLYTNTTAFPTVDEGAVRAVTIVPCVRMLEPDSLSVTAVVKVGSAVSEGYRMKLKAATYSSQGHTFEVNPQTNLPWSPTEVQNAKFGQKILPKAAAQPPVTP